MRSRGSARPSSITVGGGCKPLATSRRGRTTRWNCIPLLIASFTPRTCMHAFVPTGTDAAPAKTTPQTKLRRSGGDDGLRARSCSRGRSAVCAARGHCGRRGRKRSTMRVLARRTSALESATATTRAAATATATATATMALRGGERQWKHHPALPL